MKHKICKTGLILQNCHSRPQEKMLLILYKDFKLINKLLEETCDKSEIEIEISDNFDGYSSEKKMVTKPSILLLLINF